METWSAGDWMVAAFLGLYLLHRFFRLLGWEKGAYVAEELREALQEGSEMIRAARLGRNSHDIGRAAETAAAKVKGLRSEDVRPIIEGLVLKKADSRYGLDVSVDAEGNVRVVPAGLAGRLANRVGKLLRKIF